MTKSSSQARYAPIYRICTGLTQSGLASPVSTHLRLSGALKGLGVYRRKLLGKVKYKNSWIVAYITTNNAANTVHTAIAYLTQEISQKQAYHLVVYLLPSLEALIPRGELPPEDRDSTQKAYLRIARESVPLLGKV